MIDRRVCGKLEEAFQAREAKTGHAFVLPAVRTLRASRNCIFIAKSCPGMLKFVDTGNSLIGEGENPNLGDVGTWCPSIQSLETAERICNATRGVYFIIITLTGFELCALSDRYPDLFSQSSIVTLSRKFGS